MDVLTIKFKYDEDNNEIILNFGENDEIKVDTKDDVDLSEYVSKLTYLIQERKSLELCEVEIEDPKIKLIQDTIYNIANSYNESLNIGNDSLD